MGLREDAFRLDRTPAPLVINDFMVTVWNVFSFINDYRHLYSPEVLDKVTKAAWAIKLNRGPDMLPMHDYRVVVVSDKRFEASGTYWRGVEVLKDERIEACWEEYCEAKGLDIKETEIGYKGNRRDRDDDFYRVLDIGWEYATKYFPCYKQEGYEADDWAGALYREVRDGTNKTLRKRQKLLNTIDRDWSGLVDEKMNIWWANTRYPGPRERIQERLAGEDQVILHTKMKMGYDIEHPLEIFAAKAEAGELGDNLPPGAPIEYIDLSEYHPKYKLENCDQWESFCKDVSNPKPNIYRSHYDQSIAAMHHIGLAVPDPWLG
ncbi:MAG: hypothetical protein EB168_09805 [Euryarchaeota archaeon]|nr:hypothetical protein [Euryarchaeota archaeon]